MLQADYYDNKSQDYAKYRFNIPSIVCDYICAYLGKKHLGNFLDLGCGTGELTIPLSTHFDQVTGVDPNQQMINQAIKEGRENNINNIQWLNDYAENLLDSFEKFNLITVANAFHWLNHKIVVPWIKAHLKENSAVALIGSYGGFIYAKEDDWQFKIKQIWHQWFGEKQTSILRKRFNGYDEWGDVLKQYHFSSVEMIKLPHKRNWTIESLIGYSKSLSFYQVTSEEQAQKFTEDMYNKLLKINPSGNFLENYDIVLIIARN